MSDSKHRSWIFTINNYTSNDEYSVGLMMNRYAKYGISGREVGPKNGIPHIQGYIHLKSPMTMKAMSHCIPRARLRHADGDDLQNQTYCSKDKDFKEWGTPTEGQGARNDIKEIADLIKAHKITIEGIMFDFPELYLRYHSGFEKMLRAVQIPRSCPPAVHWRWGLAGTGKTRYVIDTYGASNVYIKNNTKWWDGYNQQQVILFDDFDNDIPFRTFLTWTDRYRCIGEIKGGTVEINSPIMFITCEYPPEQYWQGNKYDQVIRRFETITEVVCTSDLK